MASCDWSVPLTVGLGSRGQFVALAAQYSMPILASGQRSASLEGRRPAILGRAQHESSEPCAMERQYTR